MNRCPELHGEVWYGCNTVRLSKTRCPELHGELWYGWDAVRLSSWNTRTFNNNTPVDKTTPCQGVECSFEHSVRAKSTAIIVVDSHLNLPLIWAVFKVDFLLENRDFNQLHFRLKQIECFLQFGIATGCPCFLWTTIDQIHHIICYL